MIGSRMTSAARLRAVAIAGGMMALVSSYAHAQAIIADHNCINEDRIPQCWIEAAKSQFKMSYGHTSHGSQIVSGLGLMRGSSGSLYWYDASGSAGGLSLHDYTPSGDLGNPDRTTWATRTRTMLDDPGNDRNLVVWSWCGQADTTEANMQTYLDLMSDLEADYPDVTFVYMTGHLNGSGEEGNLYARNNQIRNHCIANGCALFDFADIESYDPDGDYFRDLYADDGCNYNGGNWANEWCADHSGDPLCATCSCAHSLALNCNMKARAFWWLLARMAGWDGTPGGDFDCDDAVDTGDYTAFVDCFNLPGPDPVGTACAAGDFDFDDDCDCDDWTQFKLAWTAGGTPPALAACADGVPATSMWGLAAIGALTAGCGILLILRRKTATIS